LVKPDRSFSFPQIGPGDYVLTGLDRGAGVVPARIQVTADETTDVVLRVETSRSVEIEFDWTDLMWERSAIERALQFTIEDRESGLRWSPAIERLATDRWRITGLESCDRLYVTSVDEALATIGDPFAERDGPIEVALKWNEITELGLKEDSPGESAASRSW